MAWNSFATPLIGKAVRAASRLAHGGGSAFPGKIVERIDPQFLSRTLAQLPLGVVLVSGTNGKTTTTRMVASMLTPGDAELMVVHRTMATPFSGQPYERIAHELALLVGQLG